MTVTTPRQRPDSRDTEGRGRVTRPLCGVGSGAIPEGQR
jgi:hypothetical protein